MERSILAKNWIELQSLPRNSAEAEALMWAAVDLNLLVLRSPDKCWTVILEILSQTEDEWVLTNLAAGPLESLLAHHPEQAISWVENEVPTNPKLKCVLRDIWRNLIPEDVWVRLQSLVGESGTDRSS